MSVQNEPTTSTVPKWRVIGPGLVVAATGVGAADLVATLIAGQKFGYTLLWCVVVGCLMKIVLVEGAGRYSLSTGRTIFEGWRSLGIWTTWYFAALHRDLGLRVRRRGDGRHRARARRAHRGPVGDVVGHPLGPHRPGPGVDGSLQHLREGAGRPRRADVRHHGRRRAAGHPQHPRAAHRARPAHPRRRPGQHARPGRRRRRHHHPRGVRLLAAREGLVHAVATCGSCASTTPSPTS